MDRVQGETWPSDQLVVPDGLQKGPLWWAEEALVEVKDELFFGCDGVCVGGAVGVVLGFLLGLCRFFLWG